MTQEDDLTYWINRLKRLKANLEFIKSNCPTKSIHLPLVAKLEVLVMSEVYPYEFICRYLSIKKNQIVEWRSRYQDQDLEWVKIQYDQFKYLGKEKRGKQKAMEESND